MNVYNLELVQNNEIWNYVIHNFVQNLQYDT